MQKHVFLTLMFLLGLMNVALGDVSATSQRQLSLEIARRDTLAKRLENLQLERSVVSQSSRVEEITIQPLLISMLNLAKAEVESLEVSLEEAKRATISAREITQVNKGGGQVAALKYSSENSQFDQTLKQANFLLTKRQLIVLQQKRIKILHESLKIARKIVTLEEEWKAELQAQSQLRAQLHSQEAFDRISEELKQEQESWLKQLVQLNQALKDKKQPGPAYGSNYFPMAFKVFQANQHGNLIRIQLDLIKLETDLETFNALSILPNSNLNLIKKDIEIIDNQLERNSEFLSNNIQILLHYIERINYDNNKNEKITRFNLNQLLSSYKEQLNKVNAIRIKSKYCLNELSKRIQAHLMIRKGLPGFNLEGWFSLGKKIYYIPTLVMNMIINFSKIFIDRLFSVSKWRISLAFFGMIGWFVIWFMLRRFFRLINLDELKKRGHGFLSAQAVIIVFQLLGKHLTGIITIFGCALLLFLLGISLRLFSLFFNIAIVLLAFSIAIQLLHFSLDTNLETADNIKLRRSLVLTFFFGELTIISSLLVHQLDISYEIRGLFTRLCMIFLFAIALILIRARQWILKLLDPYLDKRHSYLKQAVRLVSFLLPIGLFSNALVGLIGYLDLSLSIAAYQGIFLLVLISYLVFMSLTDELVRRLSEQFIRKFRNGWLWNQAFLTPIHRILKLLLLIMTCILLLRFYDQGRYLSLLNYNIYKLISTKLPMFDITITILTILKLFLFISILIWLAHWSREFAYRWIFSNSRDIGLRNSLSIFTQYGTIFVGFFIILYIIGVPLNTSQTISVILGSLAFGIGFGLRDLLTNFVTGFLLLLERPVKIGDWISVGTFEGQITHIGTRSITINTNDHHELVVPNSDIFTKQFINWTHHDSIVRVLIPMSFNRNDQLIQIKKIILEVLATTPKILTNPIPQVYFQDIDQSLLQFNVEYYVDLKQIISRSFIRSQFLFTLWERFQKEGISPPQVIHAINLT